MAGRERRRGNRLTKFDKEGWDDGWNERTGEQAFYGACTGCRARSDNVRLSSRLYVADRSTIARCALYNLLVDRRTLQRRVAVAEIYRQRRSSVVQTRDQRSRKPLYLVRRGVLGNLGYVAERSRSSWRRSLDRRQRYTYACLVSFKNYLRTKGRTSFAIPCAFGRSRNLATWRMKLELRGSEKRNRRENGK